MWPSWVEEEPADWTDIPGLDEDIAATFTTSGLTAGETYTIRIKLQDTAGREYGYGATAIAGQTSPAFT